MKLLICCGTRPQLCERTSEKSGEIASFVTMFSKKPSAAEAQEAQESVFIRERVKKHKQEIYSRPIWKKF